MNDTSEGMCFKKHRNRIIQILMKGNLVDCLIYMPSPKTPYEKFNGSELPFQQESIFFWLTGWYCPDSAVIMDVKNNYTILITPNYGTTYNTWTGRIPSVDEIKRQTGVDEVVLNNDPISVLNQYQGKLKPKHRLLAFKIDPPSEIDDFGTLIQAVSSARYIKFDHEIEALRLASEATSNAIIEVMKECRPGLPEAVLAAAFYYRGTLLGGRGLSFPTIAASGRNGSYLHYRSNDGYLQSGDMVLLDCGLFVNHYAGDVSRTFPINGVFSPDQKLVYNQLLHAQNALIECVKPNANILEINMTMYYLIFEILQKVGAIDQKAYFKEEVVKTFCPHSVSHHIGASVHDWNFCKEKGLLQLDQKRSLILVPNMVISIEPGLYFNEENIMQVKDKPEYSIINFPRALELCKTVCAIRIEDDVLVTNNGRDVLSTCPKTVEDIEAIMSNNNIESK